MTSPITTTIKFAWLDEDERQVSPTHRSLRAALNFINGWGGAFARMARHQYDTRPLTRTGKAPRRLARVRVVETIEPLSDSEQAAVDAFMAGTRPDADV